MYIYIYIHIYIYIYIKKERKLQSLAPLHFSMGGRSAEQVGETPTARARLGICSPNPEREGRKGQAEKARVRRVGEKEMILCQNGHMTKREFGKNSVPSWSHDGSWVLEKNMHERSVCKFLGKPKFHKPGNKNSSDLRLGFRLIPSGLFANIKYITINNKKNSAR